MARSRFPIKELDSAVSLYNNTEYDASCSLYQIKVWFSFFHRILSICLSVNLCYIPSNYPTPLYFIFSSLLLSSPSKPVALHQHCLPSRHQSPLMLSLRTHPSLLRQIKLKQLFRHTHTGNKHLLSITFQMDFNTTAPQFPTILSLFLFFLIPSVHSSIHPSA